MAEADGSLFNVLLILLCLVCSAFFSASETALTSLNTLKVKHLINQSKVYGMLSYWLQEPGRVLTTILVFNNAINIFASALATVWATQAFANSAVGIATGIMTMLILVFGEIIPKSFAKTHAERFSVYAILVVRICGLLAFPLVWSLATFADWAVSKMGGQQRMARPPITADELEFMVDMGEEHGVLESTKKQMIAGIFDFDDKAIREIMTPRIDVLAVDVLESFDVAVERVISSGISRIPVYQDTIDNVIGILLAKDLLKVAVSDGERRSIRHIMREPYFVPETNNIIDLFRKFKLTKSHLAVVIDEHGGMAGVVTMEDVLEEIVGEIQDEYDMEEEKIIRLADNVYEVLGNIGIDEFAEHFKLCEDNINAQMVVETDTLAGLLTQMLKDMPEAGQTVDLQETKIEILKVDNNRIQRVKVVAAPTLLHK